MTTTPFISLKLDPRQRHDTTRHDSDSVVGTTLRTQGCHRVSEESPQKYMWRFLRHFLGIFWGIAPDSPGPELKWLLPSPCVITSERGLPASQTTLRVKVTDPILQNPHVRPVRSKLDRRFLAYNTGRPLL